MASEWKFSDDENTESFSTRKIMNGEEPVMHVTHDEDDGAWQFLPKETPNENEAVLVHLKHFIDADPSLEELHDLPLGWHAWREDINAKWVREKIPADMKHV
jgi:hypothetical protein